MGGFFSFNYEMNDYEIIGYNDIHKFICDIIIHVKNYNDKQFQIMLYCMSSDDFVLLSCTGFVLVYKGRRIFEEVQESDLILFWVWNIADERYVYRNRREVIGKIRLLNLNKIL